MHLQSSMQGFAAVLKVMLGTCLAHTLSNTLLQSLYTAVQAKFRSTVLCSISGACTSQQNIYMPIQLMGRGVHSNMLRGKKMSLLQMTAFFQSIGILVIFHYFSFSLTMHSSQCLMLCIRQENMAWLQIRSLKMHSAQCLMLHKTGKNGMTATQIFVSLKRQVLSAQLSVLSS